MGLLDALWFWGGRKAPPETVIDGVRQEYIEIDPELLVELIRGPLYRRRDDGRMEVIQSNLPQNVRGMRAWIGYQGRVCVTLESEEFPLVMHGDAMQRAQLSMNVTTFEPEEILRSIAAGAEAQGLQTVADLIGLAANELKFCDGFNRQLQQESDKLQAVPIGTV